MCVVIYMLQRVHLSVEVGEQANDYQEIAAKDKLSELQLRVRQLLDQVDQISKEQTYQRVSFLTVTWANFYRLLASAVTNLSFIQQEAKVI